MLLFFFHVSGLVGKGISHWGWLACESLDLSLGKQVELHPIIQSRLLG